MAADTYRSLVYITISERSYNSVSQVSHEPEHMNTKNMNVHAEYFHDISTIFVNARTTGMITAAG